METWCFEGGPGDSCGTYPPWDVKCFSHEDVRAKPSQMDINYWHVDPYRADQRAYCGDYALWCGSDSVWDGYPVECGTWATPPGYGNQWNCVVQLTLPDTFDVANGCTLFFDPRYDTECKYDYFYVDFWDGSDWVTLATFNAASNNPGAECGFSSGGNPDFWGNTDIDHLTNVDWQERGTPSWPAFVAGIDTSQYSYWAGPMFRWRFVSDGAWSDADGRGNTDGGTWIDNVWVHGDTKQYVEDFESGTLDTAYWSLPDPEGRMDYWYIMHDPDPPYEGGDGGTNNSCNIDSSYVYRARPLNGYRIPYKNAWYYRLMTPSIPITNTGCVVKFDEYECANEVTCDYPDRRVRFYDSAYGTWCPWIDIDGMIITPFCWSIFNWHEDISPFYDSGADSMQFAWELQDVSAPGDFCRGKHKGTDLQVDNVSVGFFDSHVTVFSTRGIDLLQDMFFTDLCAFSSHFDAYNEDTLDYYAGEAHAMPAMNQLYMEVTDPDLIQSVEIFGSINEAGSWASVNMNLYTPYDPGEPDFGGEYYGTLCPSTFSLAEWDTGTVVWYYVKCTDQLSNEEYYPRAADPASPYHTGTEKDYFEFSILPAYPPEYIDTRILLVDGFPRREHDFSPCLSNIDDVVQLEEIYEETLTDAGYCYDKYDISGGGSNVHVHYLCTWNTDYDAVVWFTGPYFSNYLFDAEAQRAMRDYLGLGGKVLLLGDRTAFSAAPESEGGAGEDSLGGEFLSGIMGADYLEGMAYPFEKPYLYCAGVESLGIFGVPTAVSFDTLLVYRECPYEYYKDMSWIKAEENPPADYVVQPLVEITNPDAAEADMVTYSEYKNVGQSVLVNFDLCGSINHTSTYCGGGHPIAPAYNAGVYEGRVELMRLILEDVFGLPPSGGGLADVPGSPGRTYGFMLGQNAPNPVISKTAIRFEIPHPTDVSILIYNALGQRVRTLLREHMDAGEHNVAWDGRNESGRRVSSGVYFYRMQAGNFFATKKLLLID